MENERYGQYCRLCGNNGNDRHDDCDRHDECACRRRCECECRRRCECEQRPCPAPKPPQNDCGQRNCCRRCECRRGCSVCDCLWWALFM